MSTTDYEARMAADREEREAEVRQMILKRLEDATPVRYRGIPAPAETVQWREAIVADRPANLILVGPTGTGKTCAVWSTLRELLLDGWKVNGRPGTWQYHRATDLAAALRPNGDADAVIDRSRKTPLWILDDLGSAALTTWQLEQLTRIVDYRWENARPTMLTSNLSNLREVLDDRLASRLQDGAMVVVLRGSDRRRKDSRQVPTEWTTAAEKGDMVRSTVGPW